MGILAAYAGTLRGRVLRAFFQLGPIATIGGSIFLIYLYHYQVISAIGRFVHFGFWPSFAVLLAAVLASSAVWFLLIERPCMDPAWPQRLVRTLRPASVQRVRTATLPRAD